MSAAEFAADLIDRLERAERALAMHARDAGNRGDDRERARLDGKASGVALARSYVEEMTR